MYVFLERNGLSLISSEADTAQVMLDLVSGNKKRLWQIGSAKILAGKSRGQGVASFNNATRILRSVFP
jgi:prophage maintenance system killer protein